MFGLRHKGGDGSVVGIFEFVISENAVNWVMLDEMGVTPTDPVDVVITVSPGVIISSASASLPAMNIDGLPSGSTVTLTNNGHIIGCGGAGSAGGSYTDVGGTAAGGAGGTALFGPGTGVTADVDNTNGHIWGGGGGGSGGGWGEDYLEGPAEPSYAGGGGGGGGAGGGAGGAEGITLGLSPGSYDGSPGSAGTGGIGGAGAAGGAGGYAANGTATGGTGGAGGAYGAAGTQGGLAIGPDGTGTRGAGGAAGKAIDDDGGTLNLTPAAADPRIKGAVT